MDPYAGFTQDIAPTSPCCTRQSDCEDKGNKFFDKVLEDFNFPRQGSDVRLFVCNPSYWSKCQWIVFCHPTGMAYLKIISIKSDSIIAYNGCPSGAIAGNPEAGTKFYKGQEIFPGAFNCADASGCSNITECLNAAEQVCLENLPADDAEDETHALLGGTAETNQDTGFWQMCLRKLSKIWVGNFGRTFCFKSMPTMSSDTEVVDGVSFPKHLVYIDSRKGCIGRGPTVESSINGCIGPNYDSNSFSAIAICKDGKRQLLEPSCGKSIYTFKDANGNHAWGYGKAPWPMYMDTYGMTIDKTITSPANNSEHEFELNSEEVPCWADHAIVLIRSVISSYPQVSSSAVFFKNSDNDWTLCSFLSDDGVVRGIGSAFVRVPIVDGSLHFKIKITGSGIDGHYHEIRLQGYDKLG
jgi:hypothetical protein